VRRIGIVTVLVFAAVLLAAAPAWAHVTLDPSSAEKGSDAVLGIVVPNEMDNATTVKVQVQFPHDHPIAAALTEPVPGWTAKVVTFHTDKPIKTDDGEVNDAVDTVTWSAASGGGIPVGGFAEFRVSVGLPGDTDTLEFPTIQTYSNGQTVNWIESTPPGGAEPDHPKPSLTLTSPAGGATTPTTAAAAGNTATPSATASNVKKSDVDNAKTLAIVALIIAIVALIGALIGFAVGRRKTA